MATERTAATALRVVEVAGSARELGRAHGEEMRSTIAEGLRRWMAEVEGHTRLGAAEYIPAFLGATGFIPSIEAFAPSLLDEVRGIAEGARQSFETMLAYQLMDEEWWYRTSVAPGGNIAAEACSAVGVVRNDGTSLVAQNMDLPSHYDGTQVLLHLRPTSGLDALAFAPAGMIGSTGLNRRGVAICCNALPQLRHRSTGLPVGFLIRAVLAQECVDDAVSLVRAVPHATGQNYILGGPEAVVDLECSAGQVREVKPTGAQVMHTNHPLASDDIDRDAVRNIDRAKVEEPARRSSTRLRLDKLQADLAGLADRVTVEDVKRTLSDTGVPVCVPRGSDWMTLGSLVMELSAEPVMHIAPGPPAETPYSAVRFS